MRIFKNSMIILSNNKKEAVFFLIENKYLSMNTPQLKWWNGIDDVKKACSNVHDKCPIYTYNNELLKLSW